MSAHHVDIIGH